MSVSLGKLEYIGQPTPTDRIVIYEIKAKIV